MTDPRDSLDSISIEDASSLDLSLPKIGDVVAGKYQVEQLLGKGGMGVVVVAKHLELGKRVALKFLLPQAAELPNAVARFMREARASVALESDYVAKVEDVGKLDTGMPYMVMELLHGEDLGAMLRRRERLPIDEAIDLFLQACVAIAEAHALGIIHRDIKPSNLFLSQRRDGSMRVKVLDFGLVKVTDDGQGPVTEASLTTATMIAGSPQYQSPEQFRSLKDVTRRADIWSLGVVLYRMLTGNKPFTGPNLTSVCVAVATDDPKPPTALRPDIPEALERAILRCLEKDETKRFDTVGELALAVAPFGTERCERLAEMASGATDGRPSLDSLPRAQQPSVPTAPTLAKSSWEKGSERSGGSRWILVAVASVLVGGATAWWLTQPAHAPSPAATPTSDVARPSSLPSATHTGEAASPVASASAPGAPSAEPSSTTSATTSATSTATASARVSAAPPAFPKAPIPRPRPGPGPKAAPKPDPPSDPLDQWQ